MTHDRWKFYNYFDPIPYIAPKVCCMDNGEREKGENSWWCWALEKPRHIFLLCLILHRRKKQLCMAIFYHVFKKVWYFLLNFYFEVFCKIWNQLNNIQFTFFFFQNRSNQPHYSLLDNITYIISLGISPQKGIKIIHIR